MRWRPLLDTLRRWAGATPPAPPVTFATPLDYALAAYLRGTATPRVAGPAGQPALPPAEAAATAQQLAALQELAMSLGSLVNRQQLTQYTACEQLWQAYPQLNRQNLGALLWQAFVGTR